MFPASHVVPGHTLYPPASGTFGMAPFPPGPYSMPCGRAPVGLHDTHASLSAGAGYRKTSSSGLALFASRLSYPVKLRCDMNASHVPSGDTRAVSTLSSGSQSGKSAPDRTATKLIAPSRLRYRLHSWLALVLPPLPQFPFTAPCAAPSPRTPLATKDSELPSSLAPMTEPSTSAFSVTRVSLPCVALYSYRSPPSVKKTTDRAAFPVWKSGWPDSPSSSSTVSRFTRSRRYICPLKLQTTREPSWEIAWRVCLFNAPSPPSTPVSVPGRMLTSASRSLGGLSAL